MAAAAFFAPAPLRAGAPSGEVPIVFNDRHVYAKPDTLRRGRVLAALVRGSTMLVPLRAMFEGMGASVVYDASTRTVEVSKPGVDVRVTVGKPEVVLNGETRPLDVPPQMYRGAVVVPLRVIAESMGAFVLWVPEKRLVVVRYENAPPSPGPIPTFIPPPATPAATAAPPVPAAAPTAPLTPTPPEAVPPQFFIAADGLFAPQVYDEFSPGNKGSLSVAGRAGVTVALADVSFLAEGTYASYLAAHGGARGFDPALPCGVPGQPASGDPSCVAVLGPATGLAYVPPFTLRDTDFDGRIGVRFAQPNIFAVASYETRFGNYGYPRLAGLGAGLEKAPDFHSLFDLYGSVLYYPNLSGGYVDIFGTSQQLEYRYLKYQAGLTISSQRLPLFLDLGVVGNHASAKLNAPANTSERAFYAGLGLHL